MWGDLPFWGGGHSLLSLDESRENSSVLCESKAELNLPDKGKRPDPTVNLTA